MAKKLSHIMLDLETLGTRADSVIISIGAVKFDPDSDFIDPQAFYASVAMDCQLAINRHVSESTMLWWMSQSEEARAVFKEKKITLTSALDDLVGWIDHPDYCIWSNGADFDIPMINHALDTHGLESPWKFWNHRCYRTLKSMPFGKNAAKIENPLKHNALNDAIAQAQHLQAIYREMKK